MGIGKIVIMIMIMIIINNANMYYKIMIIISQREEHLQQNRVKFCIRSITPRFLCGIIVIIVGGLFTYFQFTDITFW